MTKHFFPPLKTFCDKLKLNESDFLDKTMEEKEVVISLKLLKALLFSAIADLQIDANQYIEDNPDVADAFRGLPLSQYTHHFINAGYFEGRPMPLEFDQDFYVSQYPDIAVATKLYGLSPHDHYVKAGIYEQRVPSAVAREEVEYWKLKL
jgi:hypothetical protein